MAEAEAIATGRHERAWGIVEKHLDAAERLARSFRSFRVPFEDLEAEGRLGLFEAALRFDPSHETAFPTYASWWVRKRIRDAITASTALVRIPRSRAEHRQRAFAAEQELRAMLGRPPSATEVATAARVSVAEVDALRLEGLREISLDDPLASSPATCLGDLIPQATLPQPDRALLDEERSRRLHRMLDTLSPRERAVLVMRFGLDGETPVTLAEIAQALGVSRERVHQIEREAIGRLRKLRSIL